MKDANPDAADKKEKDDQGFSEEDLKGWGFYLMPANATKIQNNKMLLFSLFVGFYYCMQFCMCCGSTNFYSAANRNATCTIPGADGAPATTLVGEPASAVMDTALLLSGTFHLIEWIRCTILLTVVCLGANLMLPWYILTLNTIYGFVAFILCVMVYTSPEAQGCAANQGGRYMWLLIEIIVLGVGALFAFPPGLIMCHSKMNIHETLYKEDDDDDEEEEEDD